ncbi:mucolipin-3-like [Ruditapes philippinarum]|uniref:mucolipin-3-like n=1 Tax=Ruditapes philippinarum TaxID=129788 RepID=UPI00295B1B27|nr:mucolipin-3-like [Ruditapes philippinarum]
MAGNFEQSMSNSIKEVSTNKDEKRNSENNADEADDSTQADGSKPSKPKDDITNSENDDGEANLRTQADGENHVPAPAKPIDEKRNSENNADAADLSTQADGSKPSKPKDDITNSENDDGEANLRTQANGENHVPAPAKPIGTLWLVFALRFFLFSPIKWKRDGCWLSAIHLVWFAIFITKTCYLTMLTFQIGNCRETVFSSIEDGYIALHHNLLKNWDASFETLPYPPSIGKFAVYNQKDLRKRINYAVENVFNAEVTTTGYFKKFESDSITIRLVYFDLELDHEFHRFNRIVSNIQKSFEPHYGLSKYQDTDGHTIYSYNITEELDMLNISSSLDRMLFLNIMFSLHTLRVSRSYNDSRCQHIYGNVTFDDDNHNGQVTVDLSTNTLPISCSKMNFSLKDSPQCRGYTGHDAKCVKYLSIITSIVDGITLSGIIITLIITYRYMKKNYFTIYLSVDERNLPWSEYFGNVNLWYITSIIGDAFTLAGVTWIVSTLGDDSDFKQPLKEWDKNVVYIGSGCLLTWFSMLRFIKINHKFTLLFKTLKRSAVDVIFFLTCVTIIFVGFLFGIYVVLGPYNVKFDKLSTTAETLFSLINGDEMFASFAYLKKEEAGDQQNIYLFSRVIIFVYVIIFTLFVLNLLIALFNSAYEVVKKSYEQEEEEDEAKDIPKTLAYFMCKDFDENETFGRYFGASLDEKNSLLSHRCVKNSDCTCGVFNTLIHFLCCHIFTICCCHCKAT